ncbi:hypothetical protein [Vibrio hippocampi]|uniref:Lipoprotein n=1 Tax=Vibrio hippocampi TaxID=654686 RepID=A0ABN8DPU6_9VIBR|nr:hypothetical protein [Vibrio hippocampi]CAH0529690.1 hypothetical protein VHP8226_03445 [Vibrio hippocampi]
MMDRKLFKTLLLPSLILIVTGCAKERYFNGAGFQVASVQQQQTIDIVVKERKVATQQVKALVEKFEQQSERQESQHYRYQVNYRSQVGKAVAQYALSDIDSYRVQYQRNTDMIADVQLVVDSQTLLSTECQPAQIGVRNAQSHCYVDAARFEHTANKARLMGAE